MNILFITADQWRGECLSTLGHPHVNTPNLDALARAGRDLFRNHFAQATPCAPSRSSLHTGMYLQNHRCVINGAPLDDRFTNWAREVVKAGYRPSLFGYTDSAIDPRGLDHEDPRLQHYSEPLPGIVEYTPMFDEVPVEWVGYLMLKGHPMQDRPVEPVRHHRGRRRLGAGWRSRFAAGDFRRRSRNALHGRSLHRLDRRAEGSVDHSPVVVTPASAVRRAGAL